MKTVSVKKRDSKISFFFNYKNLKTSEFEKCGLSTIFIKFGKKQKILLQTIERTVKQWSENVIEIASVKESGFEN